MSLAATRPIPFGGHEHGLIADLLRSCSQASGTGEVVPSAFPATRPSSGRADPSLPSLYHSTSQTTQAAQPLVPEGSVKSP